MIWREWGMDNNVKPPLILLHGGSGAWNHWVRNIPSLEQHHRLLVADLPGCGDSDDPPRPYDSESLAAMISDSIDHILPGNTPFALLSFSFGGVLSIYGSGASLPAEPPETNVWQSCGSGRVGDSHPS